MPATHTQAGIAAINQRIIGGGNAFTYIGWGGSAQTPTDTDPGLISAHTEARVSATTVQRVQGPAPSFANDTIQWDGTIQASGAKVIREVGVFDAPTGGIMLLRGTFGDITMETALEGVKFTIQSQGKTS
jgi:hypothetical protein